MYLVVVASGIRMRKMSAGEVTTACIRRMRRMPSRLNGLIAFDPEDALTQAKRADREASEGVFRGPLHGVPLAHKDMLYRAGRTTTCGSKIRKDYIPSYTATVHSRLEAAGALDLGTLNMAELAFGPTGHHAHWGHGRNT